MKFTFSSNGQISIKSYATAAEAIQAMTEYLQICHNNNIYPSVQLIVIN